MELADLKIPDLVEVLQSRLASPEVRLEALKLLTKDPRFDVNSIADLLWKNDADIKFRPPLKRGIGSAILRYAHATPYSIGVVVLWADMPKRTTDKAFRMFITHPNLGFDELSHMLSRTPDVRKQRRCLVAILKNHPERIHGVQFPHRQSFWRSKAILPIIHGLSNTEEGRTRLIEFVKHYYWLHKKIFRVFLAHPSTNETHLANLLCYAWERSLIRKTLAALLQYGESARPFLSRVLCQATDISLRKRIACMAIADEHANIRDIGYLLSPQFAFLPATTLHKAAHIFCKLTKGVSHEILQVLKSTRNDAVAKILFDRVLELGDAGDGHNFLEILSAQSTHARKRAIDTLINIPDLHTRHLLRIMCCTKDPTQGQEALKKFLEKPSVHYSEIQMIARDARAPEVRDAAAKMLTSEYYVFLSGILTAEAPPAKQECYLSAF